MRDAEDNELADDSRSDPGAGREAELRRVYRDVDARVRKYLKRRRALNADDVAQELATRLWIRWTAHGASFVAPEDCQTFAETLVRNYLRNELRRLSNWSQVIDDDPNLNVDDIVVASSPDPHDALVDAESLEQVKRWIARLPKKRGDVMRLLLLDGRDYSEIAAELGVSESTVRSHVFNTYEVLDPIVKRYFTEGR